jgi:hypothetical protein
LLSQSEQTAEQNHKLKIMKLSTLLVASATAVASATNFNLRSTANFFSGESTPTKTLDSRIIVNGLADDLSKSDVEIIGKSIIAAYNEAYASDGLSIEKFNLHSHSENGGNFGQR